MKGSTWTLLIAAILMSALSFFVLYGNVTAQGQDTCPDGGEWVKVDGLNSLSYEYTAPEGYEIIETCYKASTTVVYETIDPPQTSITITSEVENPNENAFQDLSHASFRLQAIATSTPTVTATPTMTPTPTQTPTVTSTPTDDPLLLTLNSECLGSGDVRWSVENTNNFPVNFSWESGSGDSGNDAVGANSTMVFETTDGATTMVISYTVENVEESAEQEVVVCQPEDPSPDVAAGGMGPSLLSILIPAVIGVSGLGLASGLLVKQIKKNR
jgi:hypothetical protein